MTSNEPLAAELQRAEKTLESTLQEACSADVRRADTGELIRVEEMLSIASDAAKRAISIRRKRGQPAAPSTAHAKGSAPVSAAAGATTEATAEREAVEHRRFLDTDGTEWLVRAVHPAERDDVRQARLLGSFQHGWLAFECAHGKRRLSPIPADWEVVDDAGLRALCDRAEVAPRREERGP